MELNIILENNWLEATWIQDEIQIHCESFSGHPEHIAMLEAKALEFGTSLDEYDYLIKECEDSFIYPTDEEIAKEEVINKIAEAKAYLTDTGWVWEKYNRNVLVLKNMTNEEFNLKYSDIISKQEEYRVLINELEVHWEVTNG